MASPPRHVSFLHSTYYHVLLTTFFVFLTTVIVFALFPPVGRPAARGGGNQGKGGHNSIRTFGGGTRTGGAQDAFIGPHKLARPTHRYQVGPDIPQVPADAVAPCTTLAPRHPPPTPDHLRAEERLATCVNDLENERKEKGQRIHTLERDVVRLKAELKEALDKVAQMSMPPPAPPPPQAPLAAVLDEAISDITTIAGDSIAELTGYAHPPAAPPPSPPPPAPEKKEAWDEVKRILQLASRLERREDAFPIAAVVAVTPVDRGSAISELATAAAIYRAIPFFRRVAVAAGAEVTKHFGGSMVSYIREAGVDAHVTACPMQSYACAAQAMEEIIAADGTLQGAFVFEPSFHFDPTKLPPETAKPYDFFWDARDTTQEISFLRNTFASPPPPDAKGSLNDEQRDTLARLNALSLDNAATLDERPRERQENLDVQEGARRRRRRRLAEGPPPPPAPPPPSPPPDTQLDVKMSLYGAWNNSTRFDVGTSDTWHAGWAAGQRFECSYTDAQVDLVLEAFDLGVDFIKDTGADGGEGRYHDERESAVQYLIDSRTWADMMRSGELTTARVATSSLCSQLPEEKGRGNVLTRSACEEVGVPNEDSMCVPPPKPGLLPLCALEHADRVLNSASNSATDVPVEVVDLGQIKKLDPTTGLACAGWSEAYYVPRAALVPVLASGHSASTDDSKVNSQSVSELSPWRDATNTMANAGVTLADVAVPTAMRLVSRQIGVDSKHHLSLRCFRASPVLHAAPPPSPSTREQFRTGHAMEDVHVYGSIEDASHFASCVGGLANAAVVPPEAYDLAVQVAEAGDNSVLGAFTATYPNARLRTHTELEHIVAFSHETFNLWINQTRFEDFRARERTEHVAGGHVNQNDITRRRGRR